MRGTTPAADLVGRDDGGVALSAELAAPAVTVVLPAALVALFPGCPREIVLCAASVRDAMAALDASWPGLRDRICDSRPAIRRHIKIFVDGERACLDSALTAGVELLVVAAVSGG